MYGQTATARISSAPFSASYANEIVTFRLTESARAEALEFLAGRPLHTVAMRGFIEDNGIVSPLNRGTFYGCRNSRGELEGIALIGHAILLETATDRALEAFAEIARNCTSAHIIMGEKERIEEFWTSYEDLGQEMRLACRELMLELSWPTEVRYGISGLRRATLDELDLVVPVHAQMAFEESNVNPLDTDAKGFRQRCARRINQGRTWVLVDGDKLVFKADIIAETNDVVYLEGVWVCPEKRGSGYGQRCLSQLARTLLADAKSIVLFVNDENKEAKNFYQKAGFKPVASYDTIFLI